MRACPTCVQRGRVVHFCGACGGVGTVDELPPLAPVVPAAWLSADELVLLCRAVKHFSNDFLRMEAKHMRDQDKANEMNAEADQLERIYTKIVEHSQS